MPAYEKIKGDGLINLDEMELGSQNWSEWKLELSGLTLPAKEIRLTTLKKKVPGTEREVEVRYDPSLIY